MSILYLGLKVYKKIYVLPFKESTVKAVTLFYLF